MSEKIERNGTKKNHNDITGLEQDAGQNFHGGQHILWGFFCLKENDQSGFWSGAHFIAYLIYPHNNTYAG